MIFMDLRERQRARRKQRQKRRRLLILTIVAAIALIVLLCMTLSKCGKNNDAANNQNPEQATYTETDGKNTAVTNQSSIDIVSQMTLDEKIMQLFVVSVDGWTGVTGSNKCGNTTKTAISEKPVGGIVYQSGNIIDKPQLDSMVTETQKVYTEANEFPLFIIAEEEGVSASPIAKKCGINVENMSALSSDESFATAENEGKKVGTYMNELHFNMNLAPTLAIGSEKNYFSTDAETVASAGVAFGNGMEDSGVLPVYKSFPGNVTSENMDDLRNNELLPFRTAINAGAKVIMVSSDRAPVLTGNDKACYMSYGAVTNTLRDELGFSGVIMTAPLLDDASAVSALNAGCDMLLMPKDLTAAADAVKKAVEAGEISEERIDEAVTRIIDLKLSL